MQTRINVYRHNQSYERMKVWVIYRCTVLGCYVLFMWDMAWGVELSTTSYILKLLDWKQPNLGYFGNPVLGQKGTNPALGYFNPTIWVIMFNPAGWVAFSWFKITTLLG